MVELVTSIDSKYAHPFNLGETIRVRCRSNITNQTTNLTRKSGETGNQSATPESREIVGDPIHGHDTFFI